MSNGRLLAALLAGLLFGCATKGPGLPPPTSAPRTSPPPALREPPVSNRPAPPPSDPFGQLPGWEADDHLAALAAFRAACRVADDGASRFVCAQAMRSGPVTDREARAFFERFFRPEPVAGEGLLTAYFTPVYSARRRSAGVFDAPVRPRPADLPPADASPTASAPYPGRAAIEARPAPDALAWMRPEDLFVLQVQGSGVLIFPDGQRLKAVYDGANGAPFRGIAAPMRAQGLLTDTETSGEEIRAWLAAHRGPRAQAIIQLDPRYVFFRLIADDGRAPAGTAGTPLVAGRSLAVDPAWRRLGELYWIDAAAPALTGAFPTYRRLAVALDTGGAIKGPARADLYLGEGDAAGVEAGRVRHRLRLYRLVPLTPPAP